jgi:limonene-1,2-epoxide hydrolase
MTTNSEIVTQFCAQWKANIDIDAVLDFFTDDAEYVNVPIDPPNVGKDMIRATVEGFTGAASTIEFVVHMQAENSDGTVMNERTDRFLIGDTWVELPVMGVFELTDGKISKWRDYFDLNQFMSQMPG